MLIVKAPPSTPLVASMREAAQKLSHKIIIKIVILGANYNYND